MLLLVVVVVLLAVSVVAVAVNDIINTDRSASSVSCASAKKLSCLKNSNQVKWVCVCGLYDIVSYMCVRRLKHTHEYKTRHLPLA